MAKFITIGTTSGTGNGTVPFSIPQNNGRNPREDTIRVYVNDDAGLDDTCIITQEGRPSYLGNVTVSKESSGEHITNLVMGRKGGNIYLSVPTNAYRIIVWADMSLASAVSDSGAPVSKTLNFRIKSDSWSSVTATYTNHGNVLTAYKWEIPPTSYGETDEYLIEIQLSVGSNDTEDIKSFTLSIEDDYSHNGDFDHSTGNTLYEYDVEQTPRIALSEETLSVPYTGGSYSLNISNVGNTDTWVAEVID